jgi:hypothetical protein
MVAQGRIVEAPEACKTYPPASVLPVNTGWEALDGRKELDWERRC